MIRSFSLGLCVVLCVCSVSWGLTWEDLGDRILFEDDFDGPGESYIQITKIALVDPLRWSTSESVLKVNGETVSWSGSFQDLNDNYGPFSGDQGRWTDYSAAIMMSQPPERWTGPHLQFGFPAVDAVGHITVRAVPLFLGLLGLVVGVGLFFFVMRHVRDVLGKRDGSGAARYGGRSRAVVANEAASKKVGEWSPEHWDVYEDVRAKKEGGAFLSGSDERLDNKVRTEWVE